MASPHPSPDSMPRLPILICGQGLAGTLLGWELLDLGQPIIIADPGDPVTSSKIAAGIVTPITGKRITASPDARVFLPLALACYSRTAALLGTGHFHQLPQIRLWIDDEEPQRFATRRGQPDFERYLAPERPGPLVDPTHFHGNGAGFEMTGSGWLDTKGWLHSSAAWFDARGMLRIQKVPATSLLPDQQGVSLPDGTRFAAAVFCEGAEARKNPWFPWVKWKCAKGEILTLSIPALADEYRIIHQGGWLLPTDGSGTFRSGSTYEWKNLDQLPTPPGRSTLESRLHRLLRVPWQVTNHEAAVRPIIHQSLARLGRHPVYPTLAFFNGLGSKGVLHGPRYARLLAEHLILGSPLPAALDVAGN